MGNTQSGSWRKICHCLALMLAFGATGWSTVALAGGQLPHARDLSDGSGAFRCAQTRAADNDIVTVRTTLAGVPAILRVPRHATRPPIVLWHGFGQPASEQALMEALPFDDIPAVKVYLGLPLFGARTPVGGTAELIRRQTRDFAMLVFKPAVVGAADELPAVVADLVQRGCMASGEKIGLFGFSGGGASVLLVLAQGRVAVSSAIALNASTGLTASIEALQRATKRKYAWTPAARQLAERSDAVPHAAEIARGNPPPALLLVQGNDDTVLTPQPAIALNRALEPYYRKSNSESRLQLVLVPGMPHSWNENDRAAAALRRTCSGWFMRYM